MKKKLIIALMLMIACFVDVSCKKDKNKDSNEDNTETNGTGTNGDGTDGGGTETGLYMGIIGFNNTLYEKSISLLNENTKSDFHSFINSMSAQNGTKLYDAVYTAVDKLQSATLPSDLVSVAIVTFTDGLDQGSYNADYTSNQEYLNAINTRINDVKVKGLDINAHSIGIRGNDITDVNQFILNLNKIASKPDNVTEANNMNDVYSKFSEIAAALYNESQSQIISLTVPQKYSGTKIRFTFDNVSNANNSNLYIEGTWSGNSLTNIIYQGLNNNSETTVTGSAATISNYLTFSFGNLTTNSGGNVPTNNIKQWEYITSSSQWQINSEFGGSGSIQTNVTKKSAIMILVLDCSSSLGNQFGNMQSSAKNFIDILCSSSTGETFRLPDVSTSSVSNITGTSATLAGYISDAGSPAYTEKGVCYATTRNPTISNSKLTASGSGTGQYQVNPTGLQTNQTYYVRAYATNTQGTAYGQEVNFVTTSLNCVVLQSDNLIVQKTDIGTGTSPTVYSLCDNSSLDGYTDWRLPTKDELAVLYNNRTLIGGFTTSGSNPYYWSSSDYRDPLGGVVFTWYQDFSSGAQHYCPPTSCSYRGRCVRNIR